jgi:hypothetical protein
MATFEDLKKMQLAVMEEYGGRLRACLDKMDGHIAHAIISFVMKNYDELPRRMERIISSGIAIYAGIKPNTFRAQLTTAYKFAENRKRYLSKNPIPKKPKMPNVILIKKSQHDA